VRSNRSRLAQSLSVVLALVSCAFTASCNKGREDIDVATKERSAGHLDSALAALAKVATDAPGKPEVGDAHKLAAEWLVADADKAGVSSDQRIRLLRQALEWEPHSGVAQVRICIVNAEQKDFESLRACIANDLSDKDKPPPELLAKATAPLLQHDEIVRLARSERVEDWRMLLEKYPDAVEVKGLGDKIAKHESLCREFGSFSFVKYGLDFGEFISSVGLVVGKLQDGSLDSTTATIALGGLAESVEKERDEVRSQCEAFRAHALRSGEAIIQVGLVDDCARFGRVYDNLFRALEQLHGFAPFLAIKDEGLRVMDSSGDHSTTRFDRCLALAAALDGKAGGDGGVPAAVSASGSRDATAPISSETVAVPAATFTMGSDTSEAHAQPATRVTISQAFSIDKYEVTVEAYEQCVAEGKCTPSHIHDSSIKPADLPKWQAMCNAGVPGREKNPINCVSRDQATAFCGWRRMRLPTEAEWELAARGTDAREYPWGNAPPTCAFAKTRGCSDGTGTINVGTLAGGVAPSGAYDMAGNVWEWVDDGWDKQPPSTLTATDPHRPFTGPKGVLRGGSWDFAGSWAKAYFRLGFPAATAADATGIRCAKTQ
jgi:formylglycine-generating enzyme required for sulfatase activity